MSTITELRDETRDDLKIDPGKVIWTDTQLTRWLNDAIKIFYAKANIKEEWEDGTIAAFVDGTASYTPASDLRRILWLKLVDTTATSTGADETLLTDVTNKLAEFQSQHDLDYESNVPQYYWVEDELLHFWPVPNATTASTYTAKYKYSERAATLSGTDEPGISADWHYIFTLYARHKAWSILPDKQGEANVAWQEWEMHWRKALADLLWKQGELMQFKEPVLPAKNPK